MDRLPVLLILNVSAKMDLLSLFFPGRNYHISVVDCLSYTFVLLTLLSALLFALFTHRLPTGEIPSLCWTGKRRRTTLERGFLCPLNVPRRHPGDDPGVYIYIYIIDIHIHHAEE